MYTFELEEGHCPELTVTPRAGERWKLIAQHPRVWSESFFFLQNEDIVRPVPEERPPVDSRVVRVAAQGRSFVRCIQMTRQSPDDMSVAARRTEVGCVIARHGKTEHLMSSV